MLLIFLIFISIAQCAQELSDIEKIEQAYDCDPKCWFREAEVNSSTITQWPVNCTEVCGIMNFNAGSDLPVFELQTYFKNLRVLKGVLQFSYTKYASIEFLLSLEEIHCDAVTLGVSFSFNSNLEVLNFNNLTNITCDFYAYNNTILDGTEFCDRYADLALMFVYNNFKNCKGCVSDQLHSTELDKFRGCTAIVNTMFFMFFNVYTTQPPIDLSPLSDIQNISGCLNFYSTDLHDFSFFEKLENIKSNKYANVDINIFESYNLTRFRMPALKTIETTRDNFIINVEKVHDDFCFTPSEMLFFLKNEVIFSKIEAKICQNVTEEDGEDDCIFDGMSKLDNNCSDVLGKITIGSGDEAYVEKLRNVKNIYGGIRIENTNLTNLEFLGSLEYVASLNDSAVPFQISSNKLLQNASLPNLKRVFSTSRYQIGFQENGNDFLNSTACLFLMNQLFLTNVVFDGNECEAIDRTNQNNGANWIFRLNFFILLLWVSL
ncbi:Receptor L-domain domain-containing protein [Caenorhabditis elegans]|uniref:Receptor L-domain domain-containing protein n=1 Tax=Caenorhabditis elegans TaxID=6239 RepID=Q966B5_CAEEL|nr:Receptor L-domain domain-containing protein [Caenorhabditis elegans]CCD69583.2 Receptor L-domain domain-containing protein [Caenorhabditis elegans]|eukprot:NP_503463.2 Insulin/EGF-Receptor L Domain protein [Caenorhabditis elegans]